MSDYRQYRVAIHLANDGINPRLSLGQSYRTDQLSKVSMVDHILSYVTRNWMLRHAMMGCWWLIFALGAVGAAEPAVPTEAGGAPSQIRAMEGIVQISLGGSGTWQAATVGHVLNPGDRLRTGKNSRATVQLSQLGIFRVNQLTVFDILPPPQKAAKPLLDLKSGSIYFFSREKPRELQFRTPTANGAIRGTEFHVQVAEDGTTQVALLDGIIDLANELGSLTLHGGEQAEVQPKQAPAKTAMLNAVNIIQWCLYYPAVIDPQELQLSEPEAQGLRDSFASYRSGDLLQALAQVPHDFQPASDAARIYLAALQLSVGQVAQAEQWLAGLGSTSVLKQAILELIAAVQFKPITHEVLPASASQLLAYSYALQAQSRLAEALKSAQASADRSPKFGYAWVRVAELEFSFGRTDRALRALETALRLSPRNPQAMVLKGFVLSSQYHVPEAQRWFEQAMAVDASLANAWLGRGLCRMYMGHAEAGRNDLQMAATLEPQRAELRNYLGKAFSQTGQPQLAEKELRLARSLDPQDPTSWLYSALLNQQRNRINDAIRELEQSKSLNQNRAVYRSRLLLDQDQAVRGANLASIYKDAGMTEVSAREASRAVTDDYANYSAHLFLANSYDALRDPNNINLRYETAHLSELLMAHLLAPVGAANLSQNISQQDYSRLFSGNRFGFSSRTEYYSTGDWIQDASQFGSYDRLGYAIDSYYRTQRGWRPNNDLEERDVSAQVKFQLTPKDSLYVQGIYMDTHSGDVAQYFDQTPGNGGFGAISPQRPSIGLRVKEYQEPGLLLGYHHEWSPGSHSLLTFGRIEDRLSLSDPAAALLFLRQTQGVVDWATSEPFDLHFRRNFEVYNTDYQQIWETHRHTLILGGRFLSGTADTGADLNRPVNLETHQFFSSSTERLSFYGYDQWEIAEPLQLTLGVSYDRLVFPRNINIPPITDAQDTKDLVSPKVGLIYTPVTNTVLRASYSRALGSAFFDNSVRLEPTQLGGFNQAYRSLMPEAVVGQVAGPALNIWSLGVDQAFHRGTYLGLEGELMKSDDDRTVGVFNNAPLGGVPNPRVPNSPSSARQSLDFTEKSLRFTFNQLVQRDWSLGARYRLSEATLSSRFPELPDNALGADTLNSDNTALLHQINLFGLYNHPSGIFAQLSSVWTAQSNEGYTPDDRPGDDFWQHNFYVGYRFPKRRAEVRLGLLNIADQDYQLNPLNYYLELPRARTLTASLKLNF